MSPVADSAGFDVQNIAIRPGEDDLIIEITYSERREQGQGIALYRVMMFEASRAPSFVQELLENADALVDEILVKLRNDPDTLPGRPRASS